MNNKVDIFGQGSIENKRGKIVHVVLNVVFTLLFLGLLIWVAWEYGIIRQVVIVREVCYGVPTGLDYFPNGTVISNISEVLG